jgi:hypothetical protein
MSEKEIKRPTVFCTIYNLMAEEGVNLLNSQNYNIITTGKIPLPKSDLLERVKNVDAILCANMTKIDVDMLEAAGPNLKVKWLNFSIKNDLL